MDYPVTLTRDDNNTYLVEFPDFPEAHTFGESIEEALAHAKDALLTAVDAYMKDRRDVPDPSATVAKYRVVMPALMEAKVALYRTMRRAKVNSLSWRGGSTSTLRRSIVSSTSVTGRSSSNSRPRSARSASACHSGSRTLRPSLTRHGAPQPVPRHARRGDEPQRAIADLARRSLLQLCGSCGKDGCSKSVRTAQFSVE